MAFRGKSSILNRPVKAPSANNVPTIDTQWEEERKALEALACRKRQLQEDALKRMFGTPQEKLEMAQKEKAELERHLKIREALQTMEEMQEKKASEAMLIAELANKSEDSQRVEARRQFARQVLQENQALIELKARQRAQQQAEELARDRANAARPEPWNKSLV